MTEPVEMYSAEVPDLLQRHFEQLHEGSGLSVEVIRERGARSVFGKKELQTLGFRASQARPPGLVLPVWGPDGRNGLYSYRPDTPRLGQDGKAHKYELPAGCTARLDVPPRCRTKLGDPAIPLWITEGQKKADALADRGFCAIALLGVWNFKGRNEFGGVTLLTDFDLIALNGRHVRIVFDSDVMVKAPVQAALDRLTEHLRRKGASVSPVYLPQGPNGEKAGVDDFLLTHPAAELEARIELPRPQPKAAAPDIELLEEMPPVLARPLALVNGAAYAATWLPVRTTRHESLDREGKVIRHDPPIVETERKLFVVRSDGVTFGPGGDQPLEALGVDVRLADAPRDEKLWRTRSVVAFRRGQRPDPADVFRRVAGVYNAFIDFGRSLADQIEMAELSACFSIATWFVPAFTVLGYPWPNGERGSGKTHWGTCWAGTSYLGEVVLSSGSFAALRDLADYGAALMFDDAEGLSDPKKCDPSKRELLLAGNRR